jgi:hypothetical protein
MNDTLAKPKRRWYQYSLRSLFVLTTLFAFWLGVNIHRARQQKEAVEALLVADARVVYDDRWDEPQGGRAGDSTQPTSNWLRAQLGNDFFDDVTGVYFEGWARDMEEHTRWTTWDLDESVLIDMVNAMTHLKNLRRLKRLDLRRLPVWDAGLLHVEGLAGLEVLNLTCTKVTDTGMARLAGLKNLRELNLSFNVITDAGIEHLAGMTRLEDLDLEGTKVSNAGLVYLAEMSRLEGLRLKGTEVTDAGLQHLAGLPRLGRVNLEDCEVTDEGVRMLEEALPQCAIEYR